MGALSRLVSGGVLSESHDASIVAMLQRMYDVVDVAGGDTDHAVREAALTLAVRWLSSLSMLLFRSFHRYHSSSCDWLSTRHFPPHVYLIYVSRFHRTHPSKSVSARGKSSHNLH